MRNLQFATVSFVTKACTSLVCIYRKIGSIKKTGPYIVDINSRPLRLVE
jgi:hypothetical protein